MVEYTKTWLSVEDQAAKLGLRGVSFGDGTSCLSLLSAVGYYRLTGYLYPFRESRAYRDSAGRERVRILSSYRPGTSIEYASQLIDFDRRLRMLVLDGIERVEISFRMQLGYVLGRVPAFGHLDPANFVGAFTQERLDATSGESLPSKHEEWMARVRERQASSDEAFVTHFREKYDDRMPIWALTEILELGQLGRLYSGLSNSIASEISAAYGAPTKKMMSSWISSINYVRNVSAHHARLFNRKLVSAPARPAVGQVPLLDHLRAAVSSKEVFGLYNVLAVIAFLLRTIEPDSGWNERMVELMREFPSSGPVALRSIGIPALWTALDLWRE
ncbi:Abi family protein [Subtercola vilae]|uniref:Abi family protein n=1 Tax=Subtercola vilae TaxID=2056433 RepID=A0A4T2C8K5_9MICO|nr:Abi family protein [Subtercola vilae]TIH38976.1 Abi family protein [Subtercola vilae]